MYNIDYNKLIRLLLPIMLRITRLLSFLRSYITPVKWLHNRFLSSRINDLFLESIDCTIPRLEFMLNSIFYTEGLTTAYNYRIIISHLAAKNAMAIYLGGVMQVTDEGKPVFLGQQYIYTPAEAGMVDVDFLVKVPIVISYNEVRMRSMIRSFALPDKNFKIITY